MSLSMMAIDEMTLEMAKHVVYPVPSIKLPEWEKFNQVLGGFRSNEFSLLTGPTGSGKTTFLANISWQLLLAKVPHFVASVETGPHAYLAQVMSAASQFDMNTGDPVPAATFSKLRADYEHVWKSKDMILSLYDHRIRVEDLIADLEYARKNHRCRIAFLDNLNFFTEITSAQNERIEMDRTTHELVMYCKQTDIHLVLVVHPRKTENGRVDSEYDLKGSSTCVQEASNVWLFNRPTKDLQEAGYTKDRFRELTFAKLRRRGKYVGRKILLRNLDGYYAEERLI